MLSLTLIRHGMTEGNRHKRYIGITDEPLCNDGKMALASLNYPITERLFVSPLLRCRETAQILFPENDMKIIEELSECNFGVFENKNYLELSDDPRYQKWIDSNGIMAFPDGESKEECAARNIKGFEMVVTECIKDNVKDAALVVHGGTIMNIMEKYVIPKKAFYEWHVDNGCGYCVQLDEKNWINGRRELNVICSNTQK